MTRARPARAGRLIATLAAAACAGCVDFVEPDLAERGAPAVLQLDVRIAGDSAAVEARLTPGIDEDGFIRVAGADPLRVEGVAVTVTSLAETGTRTYDATVRLPAGATAGGIRIEAPAVDDVDAPPPAVQWPALVDARGAVVPQRPDGRVVISPVVAGESVPEPDLRQWSLRLDGAGAAVTITATGLPPDSIVVPPDLLPPFDEDVIRARLTLFLSARLEPPPGDYIALITLDTRSHWTVTRAATTPAGGTR